MNRHPKESVPIEIRLSRNAVSKGKPNLYTTCTCRITPMIQQVLKADQNLPSESGDVAKSSF